MFRNVLYLEDGDVGVVQALLAKLRMPLATAYN